MPKQFAGTGSASGSYYDDNLSVGENADHSINLDSSALQFGDSPSNSLALGNVTLGAATQITFSDQVGSKHAGRLHTPKLSGHFGPLVQPKKRSNARFLARRSTRRVCGASFHRFSGGLR